MHLVIVESPTKAKKLRSYLGSEFEIRASVGHVRDLPKSGMNIDTENNFEPTYEPTPGKSKVIAELRSLAAGAQKVYLATDPDREGEAIAWHVQQLLESTKKSAGREYHRATFHEITKSAVVAAINNPTELSMNLVNAQQARRVVDRLVGYEVSPVLWKKIRRGLSAGRVQSVAVRLIVEREREIEAFNPEEYWELDVALDTLEGSSLAKDALVFIDGSLELDNLPETAYIARVVKIDGKKYEPVVQADVDPVVAALDTGTYTITSVEKKQRRRSSLPPFTTSTLQQKAATMFGYSGKQTMSLAQQLYEEGLITYHRTDSVSLSQQSVQMAREHIASAYGKQYLPEKQQQFSAKSKNAQEAHEAIRPTDTAIAPDSITNISGKFSGMHVKLYDLIWRRFVASQMSNAVYDQTTIITTLEAQKQAGATLASKAGEQVVAISSAELRSSGSILTFDGWMRLFPNRSDSLLPDVKEGQEPAFLQSNPQQKFTQPPPRYNDASLIKILEEKGIGRPSTYASIISVIEDRGYVEKKDKRFYATAVGMTVTDFLLEYFDRFMEYEFTAQMEEDLDSIARGEKQWQKVVGDFYKPFHKRIEKVTDTAERKQIPVEQTGESCPDCGKSDKGEIVIRTGKFGKFRSCSRFPDCTFSENHTQTVPDVVCPLCQKGEVVIKNTRWGKSFFGCGTYPKCGWASWKQPKPGETMTKAEWDEQQKAREERKKKRAETFAKKKPTSGKKATGAKAVKPAAKKKAPAKTAKKTVKKKAAPAKTAKTTKKAPAKSAAKK